MRCCFVACRALFVEATFLLLSQWCEPLQNVLNRCVGCVLAAVKPPFYGWGASGCKTLAISRRRLTDPTG